MGCGKTSSISQVMLRTFPAVSKWCANLTSFGGTKLESCQSMWPPLWKWKTYQKASTDARRRLRHQRSKLCICSFLTWPRWVPRSEYFGTLCPHLHPLWNPSLCDLEIKLVQLIVASVLHLEPIEEKGRHPHWSTTWYPVDLVHLLANRSRNWGWLPLDFHVLMEELLSSNGCQSLKENEKRYISFLSIFRDHNLAGGINVFD